MLHTMISFFKNKFSIPNKYLVLIAGIVWIFSASMIIKTGYPFFVENRDIFLVVPVFLAIIIFLIFYIFIFSNLVNKHIQRILNNKYEKMFILEFFDIRSYFLMFIMIIGGYTIRKFGLLPHFIIGFFYIGLGWALMLCGIKFIYKFIQINGVI